MSTGSYKQIIRATSITGIAQAILIVLKIIGNKFIAVIIGPAGIGYMGLLQSTIDIINNVSGLGLSSSAVRDVAYASASKDSKKISTTIIVLKRLSIITGIAGTIFTLIFANYLSNLAFHNYDHVNEFRLLSIVAFITIIALGQQAILQGYRKLKEMAFASIIGSMLGLIGTIPLFLIYGTNAIVPVIIISACIYLFTTWYFSKKVNHETIPLSMNETFQKSKSMIKLGFTIMLSGLFILISIYQLRILINHKLGIFYVGIFQAGWGIQAVYLQMLFQAMSRDYFPRLSALSDSPKEMIKLVNEQLHIGILIGAPIISVMLLISPILIQLMYTPEFSSSVALLQWLLLGTLLKIFAWPIAFILPALKATKVYLFTEAIGSFGIWIIAWSIIDKYGLEAIGIAYLLNYIFYIILVFLIAHRLVSLKLDRFSYIAIGVSILLVGITFLSRPVNPISNTSIIIGILSSCILITWSFFHLNRLTNFKETLLERIKNIGKAKN